MGIYLEEFSTLEERFGHVLMKNDNILKSVTLIYTF